MPSRRLAALIALAMILIASIARAASQPNIVIILTDDQGWNDTSVNLGLPKAKGINDHYRTPSLEKLAAQGARVSHTYACPVCSPSRVTLLTGINVSRHGVTNWTLQKGKDLGVVSKGLSLPDWNCNGLQPAGANIPRSFECADTLPALLKKSGYRTIHVGKAHFGAVDTPGANPLNLGFDVNIGGNAMGQPGSFLGLNNFSAGKDNRKAWDVPDLKEYHGKDVTVTEALTDRAIAEMRKAHSAGVPFFLNFAHFGVHTPIEPAKNFSADYASLPLSRIEKDYATMVADVDASVGRVMAELDKMGVAGNTIIVFLSDNGGYAQRNGGFKPKNLPLRSGKGSAYEGGLRVPCIVRWPGITQPGSRIDAPIRMEDLLPTLVKAAGVKAPTGIDGGDISAVLAGGKRATPDFIWYYPHVWGATGPGIEPFAAIREGDLKAILFFYDERVELYDITKDPSESKDLAKERPEEANRLKSKLVEALKTAGRKLPTR